MGNTVKWKETVEQTAPPIEVPDLQKCYDEISGSLQEQKKMFLVKWACVAFYRELQRHLEIMHVQMNVVEKVWR